MIARENIINALEGKYGKPLTDREKEIIMGLYDDFEGEKEAMRDMFRETKDVFFLDPRGDSELFEQMRKVAEAFGRHNDIYIMDFSKLPEQSQSVKVFHDPV